MRSWKIRFVVGVCSAIAIVAAAASASLQAQKKGQTQVPLRVVVQAVDTAGEPTQVTGDERGSVDAGYLDPNEYVHGVDAVTALLGEFGGITIDFQPSALAPRRVNLNYSHPSNPLFRPATDPAVYSGLRTHLDSTNVALQQMAIGSSQCIAMGLAYTLGDAQQTSFRNSYQAKNIASVDTAGTAFGAVTRTGENTWLLESRADGVCNSPETAHRAKLVQSSTSKGKTVYTDKGAYHVGFSLLLTKK